MGGRRDSVGVQMFCRVFVHVTSLQNIICQITLIMYRMKFNTKDIERSDNFDSSPCASISNAYRLRDRDTGSSPM